MDNVNKLTLEQQFKITIYINQISTLNKNNSKKYLRNILKQMMIKDNIIKYCVKNLIT
uniref:Uncharacterized protein ycf18 n=1 Tax=Polysiphonia urceolata TaxID=173545 RepID=A0A1Z1MCK0_POLUR|nr:phycobilisome degradation protein [Polysiphonia stricta]ARW63484.1 phycobilisome degradation protein [Polysiphonia stricta]